MSHAFGGLPLAVSASMPGHAHRISSSTKVYVSLRMRRDPWTHGPRLLEGLAIQKTKEENHRSSKRDPVDSSIAEMRSCFTCLEGTPFVFPKQFTQKWFLTKLGPNESF